MPLLDKNNSFENLSHATQEKNSEKSQDIKTKEEQDYYEEYSKALGIPLCKEDFNPIDKEKKTTFLPRTARSLPYRHFAPPKEKKLSAKKTLKVAKTCCEEPSSLSTTEKTSDAPPSLRNVNSYIFRWNINPHCPPIRLYFTLCHNEYFSLDECIHVAKLSCSTAFTSVELVRGRLSERKALKYMGAKDVARHLTLKHILNEENAPFGLPREHAAILPTTIRSAHITVCSPLCTRSFINVMVGKELHSSVLILRKYGQKWICDAAHLA